MFLDKLWVRIKGEILTIKEDLADSDLKGDAQSFLEKLERRIGFEKSDTENQDLDSRVEKVAKKIKEAEKYEDLRPGAAKETTIEELREALDKLESRKKQRNEKAAGRAPNPRVLG